VSRVGDLALAAFLAALAAGSAGCGTTQAAAAKDPVKCERDPKCGKYRGRYPDCTQQCADDWECVKRCEEVQQSIDAPGRP
jgi:hypothetical protein